ncbi:kinase RLK-Pelle-LRR-XI-1 family protein, partial [Tanacetum coccineum]
MSSIQFSLVLHQPWSNMVGYFDMDLRENKLNGSISSSLGSMFNLIYLDLSDNQFSGLIPSSLGSMINLTFLDLSHNNFIGPIPSSLEELYLGDNDLGGHIPSRFGNLRALKILNLGMNHISGSIPLNIANLKYLENIDLNHNRLVGHVLPQFGKLSQLVYLDLSSNHLSGRVSFETQCSLEHLDLSRNLMTGVLKTIKFCSELYHLDLSNNNFYREELGGRELPYLRFLNQSENRLTAIDTNAPSIPKTVHYLLIILPIIVGICFLLLGCVCYHRHKATNDKIELETIKHGDVCSIWNYDGTIAYADFIIATEDFNLKYCIGTGGYGSVYEAKLPSGKTFALKKLHRFEAKQPTFDQSFKNEIQVLTNLRHKSIVKLYGFCLHNKCNFLVYEYMENGSLFCALSDDELAVKVDWMKRANIIKDIARAMAYMHHDCNPPIVHRDISSNNILLNSK